MHRLMTTSLIQAVVICQSAYDGTHEPVMECRKNGIGLYLYKVCSLLLKIKKVVCANAALCHKTWACIIMHLLSCFHHAYCTSKMCSALSAIISYNELKGS